MIKNQTKFLYTLKSVGFLCELSFFKLFRSKEREDLAKDILTETLGTRAIETVSKIYEIRLIRDYDKMELNKIKQKKKSNKENDTEE